MSNRILICAIVGAIAASLLPAAGASAAQISVTSTADPAGTSSQCTLRQAIDSANNDATPSGSNCTAGSGADTISFSNLLTFPAHITLTAGELGITHDTTIQGPDPTDPGKVIVDGNNVTRVFEMTDANVTLSGLTVTGGHVNCPCSVPIASNAFYGGAGIRAVLTDLPVPTVNLDHVAVTNNSVSTIFNGGTSPDGRASGAGVLTNLHLVVRDTTISGNSLSGTATGDGSTATCAAATTTGAGIAFLPPGSPTPTPLEIERSTISSNTAAATASNTFSGGSCAVTHGAVTVFQGGTASVTSSTIAGNTQSASASGPAILDKTASGGGIYSDSPTTLTSDTVTGNQAANGGANLFADTDGSMNLTNTIIASPVPGSNCSGVTSAGHNFASDASCDPNGTNDVASTDPHLLALGDYGGPTQTRPPAAPNGTDPTVIDQGVAASQSTDQRGFQRTWDFDIADGPGGDKTDIGAVEAQGPTFTGSTPASPGDSASPSLFGGSEKSSEVQLYDGGSCGTPDGSSIADTSFASPGFPVGPFAIDTATTFSAKTTYGTATSVCSAPFTYQRRPALPTLTSTNPPSGSNNNNPSVIGTATAASTVSLYTQAGCIGPVAGTGTGAALAGAGIPVSVADNSTTTFYAKATGVGGTTDCSAGLTYAEVTPGPPAPAPAAPTKKKCKKAKKGMAQSAKKKCKKK